MRWVEGVDVAGHPDHPGTLAWTRGGAQIGVRGTILGGGGRPPFGTGFGGFEHEQADLGARFFEGFSPGSMLRRAMASANLDTLPRPRPRARIRPPRFTRAARFCSTTRGPNLAWFANGALAARKARVGSTPSETTRVHGHSFDWGPISRGPPATSVGDVAVAFKIDHARIRRTGAFLGGGLGRAGERYAPHSDFKLLPLYEVVTPRRAEAGRFAEQAYHPAEKNLWQGRAIGLAPYIRVPSG